MSLQLAAQHMASRGRGPDTQLVHMAPQEVAGLQALAMANGGSLTINPDTGLAEAGFLKKLLPTLIGVGLTAASGGALTPLMAAGLVGGGTALASGSLQKGLMAGLGAYGGAGLAGSLMSAGTGALSSGAGAGAGFTSGISETAALEGFGVAQPAASLAAQPAALSAGQGVEVFPLADSAAPIPTITPPPPSPPPAPPPQLDFNNAYSQDQAMQRAVADKLSASTPMDKFGAGFDELKNDPMRFMNKDNMRYGLSALSSIMSPEEREREEREKDGPEYYSFDAGYQGGPDAKGNYFAPRLGRIKTGADGGLMDIGPVQAMSDRNETETLMANGGQRFATGGEIQMQGTFKAGGGGGGQFGQANANGYQAAGGAPIPGFSSSFGQMGGGNANMMSNMGGNTRGGFDPRAVQADPQGFSQMLAQMRQREQQMPGSTMSGMGGTAETGFGGLNGYGAAMSGLGNRGAANPSARGFLTHEAVGFLTHQIPDAGSPAANQAAKKAAIAAQDAMFAQMSSDQKYEQYAANNNRDLANRGMAQNYIAPTMSRADFDASLNAPKAPINNMANMKEGGPTKAVKPVEDDPYYTMSGPSADAFKYLMGERASSRPTPVATPVVTPATTPAAPPIATSDAGNTSATSGAATDIPTFSFDPATGKLTNTGNRANPMLKTAAPTGYYYESGGPDSGGGVDGTGNAAAAAAAAGSSAGADGGPGGVGIGEGGGTGMGGYYKGGQVQSARQGGLSALSMAQGGYNLGDYSDGGRLLRGPGDGVSDSIPASIGNKRPARLADGEFVIPARIVSELGNGSTEAGARKLYAMMARVQKARGKTVGKKAVAVNSRAEKMLPA